MTEIEDERSPLLQTESRSEDTLVETLQESRSRWRSIRIMYITMFLSSIGFSIVISSIWPFLQKVDKTADTSFLGWVIATYSLGQMVASPLFGAWSNYRPRKEPLIVSIFINVAANVLYGYVHTFPSHNKYYMLLSRAFIGFGAGNVAVVRSYVAGATSLQERTTAMANISASQALGFILGPALQAALTSIGQTGVSWHLIDLELNMYTAPAFLGAFLGVANIVLIVALFREHCVVDLDRMKTINGNIQGSSEVLENSYDGIDLIAVVSLNSLFFIILFVFAIFETLMAINCILKINNPIVFLSFTDIKNTSNYNSTELKYESVLTQPSLYLRAERVGCPVQQVWCQHIPSIHLVQYILSAVLIGVGYPVCNVMTYTLYSKILGPKPQGVYMGWLTASGSGARTLGPVFVSQVYTHYGPRWTFGPICGIVMAAIILMGLIYKRLSRFSIQYQRLQ
ncbi:major facilitator superfamily domain-containing protein 8 [Chiloscyllium plagiosum]|uniref:major facilitator superfamily domain-containing protein 8 n=1 Tax=Chiloscyllium plagiosum TaxID=36176 RepID=UPI001CB87AAE|nr:major facilitator superfamily domain-containing protein 8 [Chiloscyllium plagiosum]